MNAQFTDGCRPGLGFGLTHLGLFHVPERDLGVLGDVAHLDVIELGCGIAYLSGQLARQRTRPVGMDLNPA